MAENKDVSYQSNSQSSVDYSLITPERTAKLELLIHLLSNSSRAIILCGSKGVGKTTLLNSFQQQRNQSWQTCLVQGRADLTLEQIQAQLLEGRTKTQSLIDFFEQLTVLQQKIILMVDDAGELAPYLISTLIDYAAQYPILKIVFVLSHDELAVKTYSDSAIEDCHIIEMPPLSEAQCGDFLQHLAIKSTLRIPIHSITDSMITSLYQQTHGIPAQILAQLPVLARPQKNKQTMLWWLLILLIIIIAGGLLINNAAFSSLLESFIDRLPLTK